KKSCTYSFEKWTEILNPVLRGKFNYFLIPFQVKQEIKHLLEERGRIMHGIPTLRVNALDGYVRQRLRVNFSCRGKQHGGQVQGKLLTVKYDNKFFIKCMGLVTGAFMQAKLFSPEMDIDDFILLMDTNKRKRTSNQNTNRFFQYAYAK
ncbi:hypothetical protein KSW27_12915, partial [Holdemanella biformis]